MRMGAMILGILGGLVAAMLGFKWINDANEARETIAAVESMGVDTSDIDTLVRSAYMLLVAGLLGIVGGIMAFKSKGKLAGIVLLVAVALPAIFSAKSLVGTFLLLIAMILAFLAKPKQAAAPTGDG